MGLDSIGEFNLIALRFGLAFIVAAAIFPHRLRKINWITLKYSILLGFLLFVVFTAIAIGLETTTTTKAGFLVSLTVVFVPLFCTIILKEQLTRRLVFSVILAIVGIGLLTVKIPFIVTLGDLLCVLAAITYAIHILVVGSAAFKVDTLTLGILQLGFAGLFGLVFSLLFETPGFPGDTKGWVAILALSIVCSGLGFILQTIAQKYTTPSRTGLIFSLEPVFAALFGFLFANESLQINGYIGASLVLASIILSMRSKKQSELKKIVT
jgi:drug/metabolite transporter (DMT)-like permease